MTGIVTLAICYVLSHFYRAFLAVLSPVLSSELGMSPDEMSTALGAWFVTFAACQLLIGVLLDRIGPKLTCAIMFALGGAGGGLLFAAATSGTMVLIAMILLGAGCSPILMGSLYIFKLNYDARKFATLMSVFIAVGLLGNVLGSSPLAFAMDSIGWRGTLVGLSALTLVLCVLILLTVKDPDKVPVPEGGGGYLDILKLRELWWILPLVFFNYALSGGLRGIWAGPYLDIIHQMDATGIGFVTFWMAIAMAVSSFLYGPADRIFNSRKWVVVPGSLISLAAIAWWALNPSISASGATVVLITIGMFSMSYGVLMAHATANIPNHMAGRGVTLVNLFNMGGVGLMQWVTGAVYKGSDVAIPLVAFQNVFWVYVVGFGGAVVIYLFSRDVKPG